MPDPAVAVGPAPDRVVVGFVRALRAAGIEGPVGTTIAFAEALGALDVSRRADVYWAGRATLLRRPEDTPVYDRVFTRCFDGLEQVLLADPDVVTIRLALDDGESDGDDAAPDGEGEADDGPTIAVRWSAAEVLRTRDFAAYSPEEFAEAKRMMADVRLAGALRSGAEPVQRSVVGPSTRPRRVVLLCDVSGSMEPYARALVRFLHAAVVGRTQVEAFALGTRLTRITRELSSRDPDVALAAAARRVVDWSGGTRLGDGLREFNDRWGVRGMARGAVVVILSDGWDRGEHEVMAEQMARLQRVAYRVVWVNPLKATPEYAPLARGMAAALPYVDEFVEGHSLAALEDLVEVIAK